MFGYGYVRTVFRSYLCKNTCLSKILESIDKNLNNKTVADTIFINNSFNCLYKFFSTLRLVPVIILVVSNSVPKIALVFKNPA